MRSVVFRLWARMPSGILSAAQSASCVADDMIALPVEGAPLSAERRQSNERPVADGRFDPIGRDRFMACGMIRADDHVLVSRFRRKPQPRHHRENRVPGQRQQELTRESLLAGADSGGGDW